MIFRQGIYPARNVARWRWSELNLHNGYQLMCHKYGSISLQVLIVFHACHLLSFPFPYQTACLMVATTSNLCPQEYFKHLRARTSRMNMLAGARKVGWENPVSGRNSDASPLVSLMLLGVIPVRKLQPTSRQKLRPLLLTST